MRMLLAVGMVAVSATCAAADEAAQVVSEISQARIERTIKRLAAFGTRHTLSDTKSETRGIGAARRWIKAELEACAKDTPLQVAFDEHDVGPSPRVPAPGARIVNGV